MYYRQLPGRFDNFCLSLSSEKTKIVEFGRFAKINREKRHEGKPETFNFLGFTFYCGENQKTGRSLVKVKSNRKKVESKLKKINLWLKENRHIPVKELIGKLNQSLKGYYQYYGVTYNRRSLSTFYYLTTKLLYKWLNRRSQKRSYNWQEFSRRILLKFPIALPKTYFCLF